MKTASAPLLALFATNQPFEQFDLYTFTLSSGLVLRYANCPFDVVYGGDTWLCARSQGGIAIDEAGDSGPRAHWTVGFDTGSWSVVIMPRLGDVIGDLPFMQAVRAGILQEATCRVDRGYVSAWPTTPTLTLAPVGLVNVFFGRLAEIDFGRSSVQININDPRELLDINMPRNLYTANCRYALFNAQCTLNKATFAYAATVTEITASTSQFYSNATAQPDGYFALGNCVFTSGGNSGLRAMVRSSGTGSGLITLITPMPFAIVPGDTITLYPGCDKTATTCDTKFNNKANFGGFPLIPAPETSV